MSRDYMVGVGALALVSVITGGLGVSNALLARFMHVGKPLFSISAVRGIAVTSSIIIAIPALFCFLYTRSRSEWTTSNRALLCGVACGFLGASVGYMHAVLSKNPLATNSDITSMLVISSIFASVFCAASLFSIFAAGCGICHHIAEEWKARPACGLDCLNANCANGDFHSKGCHLVEGFMPLL